MKIQRQPPSPDPDAPTPEAGRAQEVSVSEGTARHVDTLSTLSLSLNLKKLHIFPKQPEIPRIGQIDSKPLNSVVQFDRLVIDSDLDGEYLDQADYPGVDLSLHPIQGSSLPGCYATNQTESGLTPTTLQHEHHPSKGFISFTVSSTHPGFHTGSLWRVFKGTLTHISCSNHEVYSQVPAVLKIMIPRGDFETFPTQPEWLFRQNGYHTCETAWLKALHEDATLRRLIELQGGTVPDYYGLYAWSSPSRNLTNKVWPEFVAMVMEDVGEQYYAKSKRGHWDLAPDEKRIIIRVYEDLHHRGLTIQGGSVSAHHVLRRFALPEDHPRRFAIVDFQEARSLVGLTGQDLRSKLGLDDRRLGQKLSHKFRRGPDLVISDAEGHIISKFQRPEQEVSSSSSSYMYA